MSAKQGYGKIESKGVFMKWKKRWMVLKDSKNVSEKAVLLFKSEKDSANLEKDKIMLQDIERIELNHLSQEKHIITLIFKNRNIQRLLFGSESEGNDWHEQLNVVCYGSVLGKSFQNTINANDEQETDNLNNAVEREFFLVYLQPSAKLNIAGDCNLEVTAEEIQLFDAKCPNVQLVSWPIPALRRFGFDATRFTFEAGRRCDTGEGIFVFKTKDGERINHMVQNHAQRLANDTQHLPSIDYSDNENFVFRELPPIPKE